jgi:SAM-dependent methyltransferase
MGKDATFWDAMYRDGEYLRRWDYRSASPELVAIVAAGLISHAGQTLDIGCGAGRDAIFLARLGYRSIGVDLSETALAVARQRAREAGVSVEWRRASALDLPLPDSSVEFATDRGCFQHIPEGERGRYASELARVLKPRGHFLLRGCRWTADDDPRDAPFVAVSGESIDHAFFREHWAHGPVLPVLLVSDAGALDANMVVLRRL